MWAELADRWMDTLFAGSILGPRGHFGMLPTGKAKVLIVDDEPPIVEVLVKMLSPCGYEMRTAFNGEDAVSIANEFHPDCVLTGITMPGMNGLEEAVAILQFHPTCKFVFASGAANEPTVRKEYERLGFDPKLLLVKPFKRVDLLNALALASCPCSAAP